SAPFLEVWIGPPRIGGPPLGPGSPLFRPGMSLQEAAYRLLEDSCLRDRRFGPKARRTSPSDDPGRVHVGMDSPFTPEAAEALAVPVPGIDVAARAALLAGIGRVHNRGRNAVLLLEILQFLPHHRPPTVLEQPVHSTRESRRPEVQALENQVGGTVTLDDPVQDPV